MAKMKFWVMGVSAVAYLTGLLLNIATYSMHGGMPVPWDGPAGQRINARHVIGFARFGDNINWPFGWWTSVGDWLLLGGCLFLWLSACVYLVGRHRARRSTLARGVRSSTLEDAYDNGFVAITIDPVGRKRFQHLIDESRFFFSDDLATTIEGMCHSLL